MNAYVSSCVPWYAGIDAARKVSVTVDREGRSPSVIGFRLLIRWSAGRDAYRGYQACEAGCLPAPRGRHVMSL